MKVLSVICAVLVSVGACRCSEAADEAAVAHRILAGDYSTKRLGLVDRSGKMTFEYPIKDIHDAWLLKDGNLLFQTGWTKLVEMTPEKKIVWQYDAARSNGNEGKPVEVHAFERFDDGTTMIAESGSARIIEVDRDGKLLRQIKLKVDHPSPHRDTRLVRRLASGNYLVCHEGDGMVREYDSAGKIVWQYDVKDQVFSAERLASGNTLIGCGSGARVIEIDKDGKTVWSVGKEELPGIKFVWVTMVERRPNGNTVIVNCHAGPENPQMIEVTPEKKVVWTFKDFKNFGNAFAVGKVLD